MPTINQLSEHYTAERERIIEARLMSWSSVYSVSSVLGISIHPLTMLAWVDLKVSGNAFVNATEPSEPDVFAYLWRNSTAYDSRRTVSSWWAKRRVRRAIRRSDLVEVLTAVYDHVAEAFDESPQTATKGSGVQRSNKMPAIEGCISATDELASRYGCTPDTICKWPMSKIFQCQKAARIATVPEYDPLEPESLRKISSAILEKLNEPKTEEPE